MMAFSNQGPYRKTEKNLKYMYWNKFRNHGKVDTCTTKQFCQMFHLPQAYKFKFQTM